MTSLSVREDEDQHAELVTALAERRYCDAFSHLFNHFTPLIEVYTWRMGAGGTLASELAQDSMITFWLSRREARLRL